MRGDSIKGDALRNRTGPNWDFGACIACIPVPTDCLGPLGNGFRFGLSYMYGAIAANAGCFIVMALLTPCWREAWQFSAGLTLAIVAIPFYVANS